MLILLAIDSCAAVVEGTVVDSKGEAIPFAQIISQESKKTWIANDLGYFNFNLNSGVQSLEFKALGFLSKKIEFEIKSNQKNQISVVLEENPSELDLVEIHADSRSIAQRVMASASDKSSFYKSKYDLVELESYQQISLYSYGPDTTKYEDDEAPDTIPNIYIQNHFNESNSIIRKEGSNYSERIIGVNEFTKRPPGRNLSVSVGPDLGEHEIIPQQWMYANTYILSSNNGYLEFDFNEPLLDLPSLAEKKYLSPLAPTARLNYQFDLNGTIFRDGKKYYKIKVTPIWKSEALFEGEVEIEDQTWALYKVDLSTTPRSLQIYKSVRIQQVYPVVQNDTRFPISTSIDYEIKDGKEMVYGDITIQHRNISFPENFPSKTFSDEKISYADEAFDQPTTYWEELRTDSIPSLAKQYMHECDSLQAYYTTEEYYQKEDSTFNDVRFLDFILYGVGFRNRAKGTIYYFNPLVLQVNPVGIGGYRHRIGATFAKEFDNNYLLETTGELDYGFRNQDIRGKLGVGLTYVPLKFVRTFVRFGDYYDMINNYASFGSIFSRSNYVRTQSISIAQRMEVVNGLFAELSFDFSDQKPINNLLQDNWSQRFFGDVNTPLAFDRYIKSEIRLDLKYRLHQKYIIKKGKKILLGSKYPELSMVYRKGIPGLFNSEVNFDYIEFGAKHEAELGRWGNAEWSVLMGTFLNKRNLRILEHRYFRGSDQFFFSDPIRSFQLLGPTLSTANAYIRGNYFHHLDGLFLNKIPLINRLKLTEAIGAAFLSIPDQNFYHTEMYAGIERVVRIRRDLFRFGIYGATSATSLNRARFEFKLGVNFYNTYSKRWSY